MTGTVPGQELAAFGGVLAGGLLLVFLFFWLCVKVGIKPTLPAGGAPPAAESPA